ncbi:MAG: hypothetical protein U9Q15_00395 [Patescibacteria group bacterium]|nr:hypothetical protein [Patescibacteria group bacterium]
MASAIINHSDQIFTLLFGFGLFFALISLGFFFIRWSLVAKELRSTLVDAHRLIQFGNRISDKIEEMVTLPTLIIKKIISNM